MLLEAKSTKKGIEKLLQKQKSIVIHCAEDKTKSKKLKKLWKLETLLFETNKSLFCTEHRVKTVKLLYTFISCQHVQVALN